MPLEHSIELTLAGAGSGKTTRVVKYYLEAVEAGVPQGGILISTYTRKAAGEIRTRISSAMVGAGMAEEAAMLAGTRIGTVHSIGQSLLEQFSFSLGLSPGLSVMDEDRQRTALSQVGASVFTRQEISRVSALNYRLGQEGGWGNDGAPAWLNNILAIIDQARTNGTDVEVFSHMAERSVERVFGAAPMIKSGLSQFVSRYRELRPKISDLLDGFGATHEGKSLKVSADTMKKLDGIVRSAKSGIGFSWKSFQSLKWGVKDGTEALWNAEGPEMENFFHWEEFRKDYAAYVNTLFDMAARAFGAYDRFKQEAGLLDYADLESKLLGLLDLKEVRQYLGEKIAMIIIDEFQDTSPLQLAVFMKLAALVPQTVWVGDPKQAIYDFRGADPGLVMETLARLESEGRARRGEYLGTSYRSRPELVEFVNQAFENAFQNQGIAPEEVKLNAIVEQDTSLGPALGRWEYPAGGKNAFRSGEKHGVLADMLAEFLSNPDKYPVRDKAEKCNRPVRPGDIAVLCRTNEDCARVAAALEAVNIPADCERPGLVAEPEVQLCIAGLTLAINPSDAVAAAIVTYWNDCSLGGMPESDWLVQRIEAVQSGNTAPWADHPVIQAFVARHCDLGEMEPSLALPEVMELCGIKKLVSGWRNPRAHLDRLDWLTERVNKFREECRELGLCASISGFLRYLTQTLVSGKDKFEGTGGGVQVCTWHRSKGLEWPVTVIMDWENPLDSLRNMLGVSVYQTGTMNPDRPLANRELLFVLSPFLPGWKNVFNSHLRGTELYRLCDVRAVDERVRLLYTLYTRARDRLIFFGPAGQAKVSAGFLVLNSLPSDEISGWDFRARQPADMAHKLPGEKRLSWFAYTDVPPVCRPATVTPSQTAGISREILQGGMLPEEDAEAVAIPVTLAMDMGRGLVFEAKATDMRNIGNALHGCLAVDKRQMEDDARLAISQRQIIGWKLSGLLDAKELAEYADLWEIKSAQFFQGAAFRREIPLALQWRGVLIRGEADWLAEFESEIALVDHKSFRGDCFAAENEARKYSPQLAAYAMAIEKTTGKAVKRTFIHFPAMGWLMEVGLDTAMRKRLVEKMVG